jgi:membrane associated rhomboid family serine protease
MESNNRSVRAIGTELKAQAIILGGFVLVIWSLEVVDWLFFGGRLDVLGIRPRTMTGLWGILLGPFLHVGFSHLLTNTVPFVVLGWLVMVRRLADFFVVTAVTAVISGLGVWLIGPSRSIHVGASGIVFGYFGFLLSRAYFERSLSSIAWALVAILFYGGMLWGVLPQGPGISWQGHLFGFIGGSLAAYLLTERETHPVS